jgi:hypothetical protein
MKAGFGRIAALLAVSSVAAARGPMPPQAGPPVTAVWIDNDAGGQVEVWLDGVWRGSVRAGDERAFTTTPGAHGLSAMWSDGTPLITQTVVTSPQGLTRVRVTPPMATVNLSHRGQAPVWVEVPGVAPFWMLPGAVQQLTLPLASGMTVTTSVYGRMGLTPVASVPLFLRAGQVTVAEVGWTAVAPSSTVTLTNLEDHLVRVYIGGAEVAVVPPGQSRTWEVAPGRFQVLIVEQTDGVVLDQVVTFDPRRDHLVRVTGGRGMVGR